MGKHFRHPLAILFVFPKGSASNLRAPGIGFLPKNFY
jgi:hypothetical protein